MFLLRFHLWVLGRLVLVLMLLYPYLKTIKIIGTDIAPRSSVDINRRFRSFCVGNVDLILLGSLLIGSLPAIHFGTKLAKRMPSDLLQTFIALILLGLGTKFIFQLKLIFCAVIFLICNTMWHMASSYVFTGRGTVYLLVIKEYISAK